MNDPLLFIDSISDSNDAISNQETYDSRNSGKKNIAKHRLEDIEAMLYYRINVLAEVKTRNAIFEGVVLEVSQKGIKLSRDNKEISIPIIDIESINILKL